MVVFFQKIPYKILSGCRPAVTSGREAKILLAVLKEQKAASFYLVFSHLPIHLFQSFIKLLFLLFLLLCFLLFRKVKGLHKGTILETVIQVLLRSKIPIDLRNWGSFLPVSMWTIRWQNVMNISSSKLWFFCMSNHFSLP